MKRFVSHLAIFAAIFLAYIVVTHAWIWLLQSDRIDAAYSLRPDQRFLFVGSSTLGHSIVEDAAYSNKVLWVSAAPLDTTFMRIAELERRGQLECVEVLALPFSVQMLTLFRQDDVLWSWYQELPVSWRHLDSAPFGRNMLAKYILSNLRPRVPFKAPVAMPTEMSVALSDMDEHHRRDFLNTIKTEFCEFDLANNYPGWEMRFKENIARLLEICRRHDIRPVVYRQPLLPFFKENLPHTACVEERKWIVYFQAQGIAYLDVPEVYGESDFHDHMHMVHRGARRFTAEVFARMATEIQGLH